MFFRNKEKFNQKEYNSFMLKIKVTFFLFLILFYGCSNNQEVREEIKYVTTHLPKNRHKSLIPKNTLQLIHHI